MGDFVIKNSVLTNYTGPGGDVVIPEGVTSIGDCAFNVCLHLTSVTIPEGVTSIGLEAFHYCSSLTSVTIPGSVTSIGDSAFSGCSSLMSVTIPESVTSIGNYAFIGCSSLTSVTIPESVTSIGNSAFEDCSSLTSITIPAGVTGIGNSAFSGCKSLTSVTIPESVTNIGDWAFKRCFGLADEYGFVIVNHILFDYKGPGGDVVIPEGVTEVGSQAFHNCSSLTSVTIPEGVTAIGDNAFKRCFGLADEYGFVIVNHILFDYKGPGGDVVIPEGVTEVGSQAFHNCSSLTSITIPAGVTGIGNSAFSGCKSLTSVTIPESVTSIGGWAFWGCNKLKHVSVSDSISMDVLAEACLYAALDEAGMTDLIAQAKKWEKYNREEFYWQYMLSDTRAAMLLAEKRKELDKYARMRGMSVDELRDRYLSDLGLDMNGRKSYDLGNMSVGIRMNPDFSFTVELPDGKTAKSLPKKGADPEKYDAANKDFAQIKKDSRKIWKNRADLLLGDFITGKARTAEYWKSAYGGNPILHGVACLLVWEQGGKTFRRTDDGLVTADGSAYELTDEPVRVAHPIEMEAEDLEAWRKHFTSRGLKQPFAQIWERVYKPEEIAQDRYAGCPIIFFQLQGAEKHGFNQDLKIPGCRVEAKWSTEAAPNGNNVSYCDIRSFQIDSFSRAANHALSYLDRVTIEGRIKKDDADVMRSVEGCTLAQNMEYIKYAQEANAVSVLALLLEYKNANFSDFDPMDEFTLD